MKTLTDFLTDHRAKKPISFHMPGHKGRSALYDRYGYGDVFRDVIGCDITEIPGADNLHYPTGAIRYLQECYAGLYGAEHTELLVNGGSAGVIAALLASVPAGGRVLLARNTHMSAYTAISLAGMKPVYVTPRGDGRVHADDVRAALAAASDEGCPVSAVMVTSPDYYGVISDISGIAEAAHGYDIPLIVDQAHGAHLALFDTYLGTERSAERAGADLVIDSTHKTLLSFTGTGILNICSDRVSADDVAGCLSMLQTTSPSYIALASLDVNEHIMRRASRDIVSAWISDASYFRREAAKIPGVNVPSGDDIDVTKLYISIETGAGEVLYGGRLGELLMERGVWPEMTDRTGALLMTGAGSVREDYEALLSALREIVCEKIISGFAVPKTPDVPLPPGTPEYVGVPSRRERVPVYSAEGRTAGAAVTPYPPGIPLICPGERYSFEMISYISKLVASGETVIGVDEEGKVLVSCE